MTSWDCTIEVVRNTTVEADDEDQARGLALDWFFNHCVHAIGEGDVRVERMDDGDAA